jgi:thioesterase domain-containing protein
MGGVVAFEMARQLAQRGETVALAGMLDTSPPGVSMAPVGTASALSLVSRAVGLFPPWEAQDPDQPDDVLIRAFLAEAVERGVLPAAFRPADLQPMIDIYQVNGHAANVYLPDNPFKGDLHCLFTESSGLSRYQGDWERLITGELTVRSIDADHFTLMHEHHAQQVADAVLEWLKDG